MRCSFIVKIKLLLIIIFSLSFISLFFTEKICAQEVTAADEKTNLEAQADTNPYAITLYQPTYFMPFSYTSSFSDAAQAHTPENESLDNIEAKFQFSVKVSALKNIFHYKNSLNLAYTQLSFWQVYNDSAFFRETNYQPEVFFENILDWNLLGGWSFHTFNVGFIHDSNGRGGDLERSWNRVYVETIFARQNWMVSIRPWYVIQGESLDNNPDIAKFLGYERVVVAYKFYNQVVSLESYNLEHLGSKASVQLTWSFPLIKQIRGYVQGFSGYGQSLIDYNHYANSVSVGIALNDWL